MFAPDQSSPFTLICSKEISGSSVPTQESFSSLHVARLPKHTTTDTFLKRLAELPISKKLSLDDRAIGDEDSNGY
ncbi:MAG: hypothetical protein MK179_02170 [Pirellulaceae bacterium]|nr:hypothetical protein [Pirellulaceae bacterium]